MDFRAQWKGSVDFRTVPSILVYKMASQTLKWFKFSAARAQIERPFSLQSGGRVEKMVDFCLFSRRLRSLFAPPGSLRSETVAGYPEMPKSRRFEALRANTTSSFFLGRISGPWQSLIVGASAPLCLVESSRCTVQRSRIFSFGSRLLALTRKMFNSHDCAKPLKHVKVRDFQPNQLRTRF